MRIYILCLLSLSILSRQGHAQDEHVYLQLSKYAGNPGDTVWFKGYITKGPFLSKVSTNLYVELYSSHGSLVDRYDFPISGGVSLGQIRIPDSIPTANYYIKAYTRYQLNYDSTSFFSVPVWVYNKSRAALVLHKREVPTNYGVTSGTVDGIVWTSILQKGKLTSEIEMGPAAKPRKLKVVEPLTGDSTYMADFTLDSAGAQRFTVLPVDTNREFVSLLLYEGTTRVGYQLIHIHNNTDSIMLTTDTLSTSPLGYNSWEISFPENNIYTASVSVSDADRTDPPPAAIWQLDQSRTDDLTSAIRQVDDSYIAFRGVATSQSGKTIKKSDIVFSGIKDTSFLFTKVTPIDPQGNFTLDSLFFFGSMDLQFQINKEEGDNAKNIRLTLSKFVPPLSDSSLLLQDWEDDSMATWKADTVLANNRSNDFDLSKSKNLTTVVVNGWKSSREELDHKYTSGVFSEPTAFSFDLRSETRYSSLEDFLRTNIPGIQFDPATGRPKYNDTSVLFYVDETVITWDFLKAGSFFKELAYAKAFINQQWLGETPFSNWSVTADNNMYEPPASKMNSNRNQPPQQQQQQQKLNLKNLINNTREPLVVCLYTRKGEGDFRMLPGGMNRVTVKGYSGIQQFTPDKSTLFWDPAVFGKTYRIRFRNNDSARRFRVTIEGINYKGKLIHFEKIME